MGLLFCLPDHNSPTPQAPWLVASALPLGLDLSAAARQVCVCLWLHLDGGGAPGQLLSTLIGASLHRFVRLFFSRARIWDSTEGAQRKLPRHGSRGSAGPVTAVPCSQVGSECKVGIFPAGAGGRWALVVMGVGLFASRSCQLPAHWAAHAVTNSQVFMEPRPCTRHGGRCCAPAVGKAGRASPLVLDWARHSKPINARGNISGSWGPRRNM